MLVTAYSRYRYIHLNFRKMYTLFCNVWTCRRYMCCTLWISTISQLKNIPKVTVVSRSTNTIRYVFTLVSIRYPVTLLINLKLIHNKWILHATSDGMSKRSNTFKTVLSQIWKILVCETEK